MLPNGNRLAALQDGWRTHRRQEFLLQNCNLSAGPRTSKTAEWFLTVNENLVTRFSFTVRNDSAVLVKLVCVSFVLLFSANEKVSISTHGCVLKQKKVLRRAFAPLSRVLPGPQLGFGFRPMTEKPLLSPGFAFLSPT